MPEATSTDCNKLLNPWDAYNSPLEVNVLMLIHCIRESIFGYCAVSGFAVLNHVFQQADHAKTVPAIDKLRLLAPQNNDIDVFVPRFPFQQKKANGYKVNDRDLNRDFFNIFTKTTRAQFNSIFSTHHEGIFCHEVNQRELAAKSGVIGLLPAIHRVLSIHVRGSRNQKRIVNIFVLDYTVEGNWEETIPLEYDINVIKLKVSIDEKHFFRPAVSFVDPTARESVLCASFDYVVAPLQEFSEAKARIEEMMQRGFALRSLSFDHTVPPLWKRHWICQAQLHFAPFWIKKMMRISSQKTNFGSGSFCPNLENHKKRKFYGKLDNSTHKKSDVAKKMSKDSGVNNRNASTKFTSQVVSNIGSEIGINESKSETVSNIDQYFTMEEKKIIADSVTAFLPKMTSSFKKCLVRFQKLQFDRHFRTHRRIQMLLKHDKLLHVGKWESAENELTL